MPGKEILLIEAFYGGSHKQLIDMIVKLFPEISDLFTMTAKKWHWRAITSPLHFSNAIPRDHNYRVLFSSSVLPLAEFIALRPDLGHLHKIVYFHENQLVYPVQERKDRYFQHGYNDILTCLVADKILFNSNFNKQSFLNNISKFFNVLPDYKPKNIDKQIIDKCEVVYFPIDICANYMKLSTKECNETVSANLPLKKHGEVSPPNSSSNKPIEALSSSLSPILHKAQENRKLHIVWPHRWEHDKDPETFFSVIYRLKDAGADFYLSAIGETFSEKPSIFEEAETILKDHILNWGYQETKEKYFEVLQSADVVVSTAKHEFFGVSILEAIHFHCYPLCPNKLAYQELYPDKYLYNTPNQLYKKLKYFCKNPKAARAHTIEVDLKQFSWETIKTRYTSIFVEATAPKAV